MLRRVFWIAVALMPFALHAQTSKAGQAGATFLSLPYSVRGASMGNAFILSSDYQDPSLIFHNPAGMATISDKMLYAMSGNWMGTYPFAISYVSPAKNGVMGVFMSGIYVGGIESYGFDASDNIVYLGEISYLATQLGFGYATFLTDKFMVGGNLKLIYEGYGGYSMAYSLAMDVGTFYYTGYKDFTIGTSIKHFGFDAKLSGTYVRYQYTNAMTDTVVAYSSYKLPTVFGLAAFGTVYSNSISKLKAVLEMSHPVDNIESYNIGFEYSILNIVYVRGGYRFFRDSQEAVGGPAGFNLGFGILYGKFALDYAYLNRGLLPPANLVSITYKF